MLAAYVCWVFYSNCVVVRGMDMLFVLGLVEGSYVYGLVNLLGRVLCEVIW